MIFSDMRRFLLTLVVIASFGLGSLFVHAKGEEKFILDQSYFSDKTNGLTFEEARSEVFTPYDGVLTAGFSKGAYWVKLDIRANPQDLVLKIRPSFINQITLYDPYSAKTPRTTGSLYLVSDADIESNSFNFVLPPSSENRTVYLRIKSVSSYFLYVQAMPRAQYEGEEKTDNLIYAGYLMLTLIVSVWLFITWLIQKDFIIGLFAFQQVIAVAHTFSRVGFSRTYLDQYIGDVFISTVSNGIVVIYPFVGIFVNKLLLRQYGLKPIFDIAFNIALGCSMGLIVFYLFGHHQTALSLNAPLVLFVMIFFCLCAFFGLVNQQNQETSLVIQVKALKFYYLLNLIIWIIAILPLLGILSTGPFAMHSLLIYNVTSSLFFFAFLQFRARWLLENQITRASALEAQASQERQRREEQGMLMAMLSHEIKTPLSVLKLVMDEKVAGSELEGHANRAVNNINFIVNRCLQLGKLDAKAIQLNPTRFSAKDFVSALLQDIQGASRVQTDIPYSLVLSADREILRVVLNNLIENALKYGDIKQVVRVSMASALQDRGERIRVDVCNCAGPLGVPDAEQVFKKYYRNTQATKVTGSGLGLFLVHELVAVMGGEVTYTNQNDEVIFSLWIPA